MTVRVDRVDDEPGFRALRGRVGRRARGEQRAEPVPDVGMGVDVVGALRPRRSPARAGRPRRRRPAPGHRAAQAAPASVLGLGLGDVVEFIGAGGDVTPEQLDFIVRRGAEASGRAGDGRALYDDPRVAGLDLQPLADTSPIRPWLLAALRGHGTHPPGETPHSVCPVLPLPATWEAFQLGRSRNYRKKIGEYQRRCVRDLGATVRLSTTPAELDRDMSVLVDLHAAPLERRLARVPHPGLRRVPPSPRARGCWSTRAGCACSCSNRATGRWRCSTASPRAAATTSIRPGAIRSARGTASGSC